MSARYERHVGSVGAAGQQVLLASRVMVVGLGGLGGSVLESLVRIGVGHLSGVDPDVFDASNLNRQILCTMATLGESKAVVAARRVAAVNPDVDFSAQAMGFAFAPGVCTPSDVECAVGCGARDLKFFPAEAVGGTTMLKALIGPYGHLGLQFCPTGGIHARNMAAYFALPHVAVVGGTWIAGRDAMAAGEWDDIGALAREAVARVAALR